MFVRKYFVILLSLVQPAMAQQLPPVEDMAVANAISSFHNAPGFQPALYNGSQYYGYHPSIKGFPHFESEDWINGTVVYDGIRYKNVSLRYDLVANKLMVLHVYGTAFYLFGERVSSFTLQDKSFIHLDSINSQVRNSGFYEQVVQGNVTLLAFRSKIIREKIVDLDLERDFVQINKYYLVKDGRQIPVSNLNAVLKILKDQKRPIKQYLNQNRIRYRVKNPEPSIVAAVRQYNELLR